MSRLLLLLAEDPEGAEAAGLDTMKKKEIIREKYHKSKKIQRHAVERRKNNNCPIPRIIRIRPASRRLRGGSCGEKSSTLFNGKDKKQPFALYVYGKRKRNDPSL